MKTLPESVIKAREYANVCSDKSNEAWNKLSEIPSIQELEEWLAVKEKCDQAQEEFERKLRDFLNSGLNA